jgi:hypothetical protein
MTGLEKEVEQMSDSLKQGGAISIFKTDKVQMEYVQMPPIDTSYRFIYRLVKPMPTIWQEGKLTLAATLIIGLEECLRRFAVSENDRLFSEAKPVLPQELRWLTELGEATVHQCEIVRCPEDRVLCQ